MECVSCTMQKHLNSVHITRLHVCENSACRETHFSSGPLDHPTVNHAKEDQPSLTHEWLGTPRQNIVSNEKSKSTLGNLLRGDTATPIWQKQFALHPSGSSAISWQSGQLQQELATKSEPTLSRKYDISGNIPALNCFLPAIAQTLHEHGLQMKSELLNFRIIQSKTLLLLVEWCPAASISICL